MKDGEFEFEVRFSQDQTGPKGQYIKTNLARRASTSRPNWSEGPVSQDQAGAKSL